MPYKVHVVVNSKILHTKKLVWDVQMYRRRDHPVHQGRIRLICKLKFKFQMENWDLNLLIKYFSCNTPLYDALKKVSNFNFNINPLQPGVAFLYPLKTSENLFPSWRNQSIDLLCKSIN